MLQRLESVSSLVVQDERLSLRGLFRERVERRRDVRVLVYETTIEVSKPKERLNVLDRTRAWPARDGVKLARVHLDTGRADDVPEELDFGLVELALISKKMLTAVGQCGPYSRCSAVATPLLSHAL